MLKSLKNRRNRKGFTLAELLIVVAIIAVLVAIAVPLFVGQINEARKTTFEANKRAARGAVITALLKDGKTKLNTTAEYYSVVVDKTSGKIGDITKETTGHETPDYETWQSTGKIIIEVQSTDLTIKNGGGT